MNGLENLTFKDSEDVKSFNIPLTAIVNNVEMLGDLVIEHKAMLNFLQSVLQTYKKMVMAIESLLNFVSAKSLS